MRARLGDLQRDQRHLPRRGRHHPIAASWRSRPIASSSPTRATSGSPRPEAGGRCGRDTRGPLPAAAGGRLPEARGPAEMADRLRPARRVRDAWCRRTDPRSCAPPTRCSCRWPPIPSCAHMFHRSCSTPARSAARSSSPRAASPSAWSLRATPRSAFPQRTPRRSPRPSGSCEAIRSCSRGLRSERSRRAGITSATAA